jgi:hypothetical protein
VCGRAEVVGVVLGDLVLLVEKCRACARDPCGEEASGGWWERVDGVGVVIGKYVDLGVGVEFFEWCLLVLVAFDVEDVDGHGKGGDHRSDGLHNVVVGGEELEGGGEVINRAVDIEDYSFVVDGDG